MIMLLSANKNIQGCFSDFPFISEATAIYSCV